MKRNKQVESGGISSIWFGIFTLILALTGSWISFHVLVVIINGFYSGASFSLSGIQIQLALVFLIVAFVTPVITVFLFIISYRLITSRGRQSDRGFMNPSVLTILSVLTVGIGILGFYIAWTEKGLNPAIGGVVFSIAGVKGIFLSMDRFRKTN